MAKTRKIYLILFLVVFIFLTVSCFSLAQAKNQGKPLEETYPNVPKAVTPTSTKTALPDYVGYIFNLSIMVAGLVAFGSLVYGGFRYLTSAGNPSTMSDAQDQILSAFLGLILLLSSWLILHTINPQLVVINLERPALCNCDLAKDQWPWPKGSSEYQECDTYCTERKNPFKISGVYLLTDKYKEGDQCTFHPNDSNYNCLNTGLGDISNLSKFNDKAKKIKFVQKPGINFWAILHEDKDFKGQCRIFSRETGGDIQDIKGQSTYGVINKPSSINVFLEATQSSIDQGIGVTFYSEADYTGYHNPDPILLQAKPKKFDNKLNDNVRSIKIDGKYLVVLFENSDATGKCEVFRHSRSNLKNDPIGKCGANWFSHLWRSYKPCASSYAVYPLK